MTRFWKWQGNVLVIALRDDITHHMVNGRKRKLLKILHELSGRHDLRLSFVLKPEFFPAAMQHPADDLAALQKKYPTVQALVKYLKVVPAPNQ